MTRWRRAVAPIFFALCLVLGGASRAGEGVNMLLQLGAIGLFGLIFHAENESPMGRPARQLLALLVLMGALIAIQLIPLPPALWAALPGRAEAAEGYRMLGMEPGWLPLSLAPHKTIASALWLLPAFALLLALLRLDLARLPVFGWIIVAVTAASAAIGAIQSASGEGSSWYFYTITNYGVGTGFFANANHLATLLVATLPFIAALYLAGRGRKASRQRASAMTIIAMGMVVITLIGLAVNRSIAGLGLAVPVAAASIAMIVSRRRRLPGWTVAVVGLLLAGSVAVAFSAPFGNNLTGAEARASEASRLTSFTKTLPAAVDYLPTGSGIGTFPEIYPTLEDPAEVPATFMNHVHSDYIELFLETGLPGIALILLFLAWWTRQTVAIWRSDEPEPFARAASIASAAILAHSLVDYPLRTVAISALLTLCCAIMADPRPRLRRAASSAESEARHLSAD